MWCPTPNQGQGSTTSEKWNEAGFGSVEETNNCNHNNIVLRRTMVNISFIIILALLLSWMLSVHLSIWLTLLMSFGLMCFVRFDGGITSNYIQLQFHMFDGSLSMMNTWFWFFVKPFLWSTAHRLHFQEVSSSIIAVGDLENNGTSSN